MTLNQTFALNWSGDGSSSITGSVPLSGDTIIVSDVSLINGTVPVALAIRAAGLQGLYLKSTVDCTITFRDAGGTSVGSKALLATVPYVYASGIGTTPISDDVVTATVVASATGTLQIRGIQDGTPATATAALSGTITSAVESQIVTGGRTIILTLTGATWQPTGTAFSNQRRAIIDGIDSAQAEAAGWDAQKVNLLDSNVVRTSATIVTITLSALGSYVITANEVLTATIPASATSADAPIVASPTATITANS